MDLNGKKNFLKKPKDACGVVGIATLSELPLKLFFGLRSIQHRGQESAGISIYDNGIKTIKGMGEVEEVFSVSKLANLKGILGIGHVRYSTTGGSKLENAQPITVNSQHGDISIAHNGDLVNATALREDLQRKGWAFITSTDSEIIVRLLANELKSSAEVYRAVKTVVSKISGSYAITMLVGDRLFALRDPLGIKPLCIGRLKDGYVAGSESVIIDVLDGDFVRDVNPGELVEISHDEIKSVRLVEKKNFAHCMFEWVYFARPDSVLDGRLVYEARKNLGKVLAIENPVDADLVVPIPDSGRTHAFGYSEEAQIPYAEGLMVNRYVNRTFIMPSPEARKLNVRLKLNPIKKVLNGKRVVLVDDSIVRGTTMQRIVGMVRNAGAKEVHVRIGSPPIVAPCYLGIDMKTREQFIATNKKISEICKEIGADSLGYVSIRGLIHSIGIAGNNLCLGCVTGRYPLHVEGEKERLQTTLDIF